MNPEDEPTPEELAAATRLGALLDRPQEPASSADAPLLADAARIAALMAHEDPEGLSRVRSRLFGAARAEPRRFPTRLALLAAAACFCLVLLPRPTPTTAPGQDTAASGTPAVGPAPATPAAAVPTIPDLPRLPEGAGWAELADRKPWRSESNLQGRASSRRRRPSYRSEDLSAALLRQRTDKQRRTPWRNPSRSG